MSASHHGKFARRRSILLMLVACAIFAIAERAQHPRIAQHGARLIERADHVLAERVIYRRLAADG